MLLSVEDLRTQFQTEQGLLTAVDGVSFQVAKGEMLGIVGESGCGKSVTAMSILSLLPKPPAKIANGRILYEGTDLLAMETEKLRAIRGADISMIFQEPMTSLNPVYTVGFQVGEAIQTHEPDLAPEKVKERVLNLLRQVGMADVEKRYASYPHQLSGGMRQRVMIAMALSCNPKLLIADEPTTALDVTIQAQILELLKDLQKRLEMSVILITHDLGVVAEMVDRVVVMYAGKVIENAPVAELFSNPKHPYTKGLMASLPSAQRLGQKLTTIPGNVPPLDQMPSGCRFRDRCELAQEHCSKSHPDLELRGDDHYVSCFEVKE